jgi:hypothetical protein
MTKRLPHELICEQPSQSRDNISCFFLLFLLISFSFGKQAVFSNGFDLFAHMPLAFWNPHEVLMGLLNVVSITNVRINRLIV